MREDVMAVQAFIDTMVGIDSFSYPARQNNAPKPAGDFAHIRLIEEYQIGIPNVYEVEQPDDTLLVRTVSPVRLRFRVGIIEDEGIASTRIMHGWTSERIKELMISTGYGFIHCRPISSEDAQLEKEWEFREGFSIEFYATRIFEEIDPSNSFINTVDISGKYIFASEEILLQYNINN